MYRTYVVPETSYYVLYSHPWIETHGYPSQTDSKSVKVG